jgi:hypothetical protein
VVQVGPARRRQAAVAVLALAAVDLASAAGRLAPFYAVEEVFPRPPVYDFLAAQGDLHRVVSVDGATPGNVEMVYGLETPSGYDYAMRRTAAMIGPFLDRSPVLGGAFRSDRVASRGLARRLDLLGVRWIVADRDRPAARLRRARHLRQVYADRGLAVFENPTALPRAFLVPLAGAREMTDDEALERLGAADFDPRREVLAAEGDLPESRSRRRGRRGPRRVPHPEVEVGVGRVTAWTAARVPAVLVVTQAHDPGWSVRVDGEPAPLLRVDHGLQGVALPRGAHRVELSYRPATFAVGATLSSVSLLLLSLLAIWPARRGAAWRAGVSLR